MNLFKIINRKICWWTGSLLLIVPPLLHAYFLMPFPGSQDTETIQFAYILEKVIPFCRITGIVLLAVPVLNSFFYGTLKKRIGNGLWCIILVFLYHYTDSVYSAEIMFKEPMVKRFEGSNLNTVPAENLIIGIENNGEAKAYPVNFIGYHHKVQDSVGGMPVLVTYCTMCRTARVFSPLVNGKYQQFRLVGARHYNAVIEDRDTKSWWYQATGESAAGEMKGTHLKEISYEQLSLQAWLQKYPDSKIMQPDPGFSEEYEGLKEYDRKLRSDIDSLWQRKSWVIGVAVNNNTRAYEWQDVLKHKMINDRIGDEPLLIFLYSDHHSFNAWSRKVNGKELSFEFAKDTLPDYFKDISTCSTWNANGECTDGFYKNQKLKPVRAYQEYWHSWKYFHPGTSRWNLR